MSSKKCIYKTNKLDDDFDSLGSPCLLINPDIEFKDVPSNGEEYLLTVIKERKNYSFVTKCNKDYSKFASNQSCFVEEVPRAKAPPNLKPTIEWQNMQVADFSDIRMYISRMLAKKSEWPTKIIKTELNPNNVAAWKNMFDKRDPTLSCLLGLHSSLIDRGLEILTEVLDDVKPGCAINHKTGQWIYALLSCVRQPLLSDTTSILRNLARKCAELRSHLDPEKEDSKMATAPLNIFICLVARYFRQHDLAD